MPRSKPDSKPERDYALWVVVPDVHLPHEDKKAVAALEQYLADEWWDGWCQLGDLLDNQSISDFDRDYPLRRVSAMDIQGQYDYANPWLDRHLGAATKRNPKCRKVMLSGNHEERSIRYGERNPEMRGLMDYQRHLNFKERGIEHVDFWGKGDLLKLGKLFVGHGIYTVQNHAAKHVRDFGCNLLYGHTHDIQSHYIRRRGSNQPLMAQSIGCLCKLEQGYMKGRPNNWISAFAVVFLFPDGSFQHQVVPILGNRFVAPGGKVYRA